MTVEQLFRQEYPDAFVDDDREWVRIRNMREVTEVCPHCHQGWTHKVIDYGHALGAGNCESAAWEDALRNFKRRQRLEKKKQKK